MTRGEVGTGARAMWQRIGGWEGTHIVRQRHEGWYGRRRRRHHRICAEHEPRSLHAPVRGPRDLAALRQHLSVDVDVCLEGAFAPPRWVGREGEVVAARLGVHQLLRAQEGG
jgi:hypothetical protein